MQILGVDLSHHQGLPNMAAVKASGRAFVVLKASEGTTYKDPNFDADRAAAHAAGLIVLIYHFARAGDPAAEAAWFQRCVGRLQVGEGVVIDDEVAGVTAAWVKTWCDAVFAATTVKALVYMNKSALAGGAWAPVVADNDGLWLAVYDGSTAVPAGGPWGSPAMKQYSDAGVVAGIAGAVDLDVFYGTAQQLLSFGLRAPQASPQEVEMRLARTPDGTIWAVTDTRVVALTDPSLAADLQTIWGPYVSLGSMAAVAAFADSLRGLAEQTLNGYGRRVERIDVGGHTAADGTVQADPWGYGTRIETIQGQVAQILAAVQTAPTGSVDAAALAAAVVAEVDADVAKRFSA